MSYTGYQEVWLNNEDLAAFYEKRYSLAEAANLGENEYISIMSDENVVIDRYVFRNGELSPLSWKPIQNNYTGNIKPRNPEQMMAMDMLQNKRSTIKILTGRYGSGKTMLMVVSALEAVAKGDFKKIVWVRNNIEVKNSTPLGALPGDIFGKLLPYAMPLADHVGGTECLEQLMDDGIIEVQHLGFIRGRDIRDSIIISSEAENLTKAHVQLLIGRVGEGSNLWLDGDLKQTDKDVFEKENGLTAAINGLRGHPLFSYVHLKKSERSETASLADLLD